MFSTCLTNLLRTGRVIGYSCSFRDDAHSVLEPGPSGYVNADLIQQHFAPPSLGDKVKVFVCGESFCRRLGRLKPTSITGPPPQVLSLAGKKDGPRQGELSGILKDLGYTTDQVGSMHSLYDM